jgi:hypothetical protein
MRLVETTKVRRVSEQCEVVFVAPWIERDANHVLGARLNSFAGTSGTWCCSETRHARSARWDLQAELLFRRASGAGPGWKSTRSCPRCLLSCVSWAKRPDQCGGCEAVESEMKQRRRLGRTMNNTGGWEWASSVRNVRRSRGGEDYVE